MVKILVTLTAPLILLAATYEIIEPDFITQAESRKDILIKNATKQLKSEQDRLLHIKGETLTKASHSHSYYVDPTYTLDKDIPRVDNKGNQIGILYPKGYTFNPVKYMKILPPPIVVFNACDKKEVALVKQITSKNSYYMFASSGCEIGQFPKDFGKPLYLVTKEMKQKFQIKYTVSVVSIDKNAERIKVEVYKTN